MAYGSASVDSGTGIDVAVDTIATVKFQRIKLGYGVEGSATDVSSSNPLPVSGAVTQSGAWSFSLSAAIPAGTNNIGDVDVLTLPAIPSGSNTIGSIASITTGVIPGTTGPSLGKQVGGTYNSTDTIIPGGNVRDDALSSLTETEGKWVPDRCNANGAKWVAVDGAITGSTHDSAALTTGVHVHDYASTSAPSAVASGDAVRGWSNLNGARAVFPVAHSVGGYTPGRLNSAASNNATSVKASAGTLGYLTVINTTATIYYLKFYNKASAPAPGSDNALLVQVYPIPANTSGTGITCHIPPQGLNFSTGIAFALVAGASDTDNTSAATGVFINYGYA